MMSVVKPRLAVGYHSVQSPENNAAIMDGVRKTYDGLLALARDLMVINVTKETIKVRMATVDEYVLPPNVTEAYKEVDNQASPKCAKFSKNPGADIGDIIHAGCKPTLAQMSALMDNPVGNVAMMWNQIDYYGLENPKNNKSDNKTNYMGIIHWI